MTEFDFFRNVADFLCIPTPKALILDKITKCAAQIYSNNIRSEESAMNRQMQIQRRVNIAHEGNIDLLMIIPCLTTFIPMNILLGVPTCIYCRAKTQ
jgi:hypothetical protein